MNNPRENRMNRFSILNEMEEEKNYPSSGKSSEIWCSKACRSISNILCCCWILEICRRRR